MWGKLENNRLIKAPMAVVIRQTHYNPVPDRIYHEMGYKLVIETPMPTERHEGYYWTPHWVDTGTEIDRVWEEVEEPTPIPSPEEQRMDMLEDAIVELAGLIGG